ncbi:hypothetical protein AWZ03_015359, partial [Drosophila navojoa]
MKVFITILALAIASASGAALPGAAEKAINIKDISGRITNGYPAYEGKAPYTVGLGFSGGWWCGGSIIGHTWVLTAEHCTGSDVTVYFGATWRTNAQFTHWVSRNDIINHH